MFELLNSKCYIYGMGDAFNYTISLKFDNSRYKKVINILFSGNGVEYNILKHIKILGYNNVY